MKNDLTKYEMSEIRQSTASLQKLFCEFTRYEFEEMTIPESV